MGRSQMDLETWATTTESVHSVNVYNGRGDKTSKVVGGRAGQRVQLTSDEREDLNEEVAANAAQCIFRNGFLRPVRGVPDDVMERFKTETEPHAGMDAEVLINALDTMDGDQLKAFVDELTPATLHRFRELAGAADARASQVAIIEERLNGDGRRQLRETATDKMLRQEPLHQGPAGGPVQ
jgi:hypothetical protein